MNLLQNMRIELFHLQQFIDKLLQISAVNGWNSLMAELERDLPFFESDKVFSPDSIFIVCIIEEDSSEKIIGIMKMKPFTDLKTLPLYTEQIEVIYSYAKSSYNFMQNFLKYSYYFCWISVVQRYRKASMLSKLLEKAFEFLHSNSIFAISISQYSKQGESYIKKKVEDLAQKYSIEIL